MTLLEWCPKKYSAGDIDGAGLRKLLGASHHAPLALLVRETIQNSWDASRSEGGSGLFDQPPSWTFELRSLTRTETRALTSTFETLDVPGTALRQSLSSNVRVIEISDRRTVGLGGPLRYDRAIPPGAPTDFIDLVYNVGAPQDTEGGGGTYGFGKIAAFGVSQCSTVLYYTHPLIGEMGTRRPPPRLIGSTIGDNFELDDGNRYTGRHWWGRQEGSHPRPLTGDEATRVARPMFRHGFTEQETGTSLLVLQPDLDGMTPEEAIEHVVDAVLWNAWPKLVPRRGRAGHRPMDINVQLDGEAVEVPDPASRRPFSGFVSALHAVRASLEDDDSETPLEGDTIEVTRHEFWSGRPNRLVGHVGMARCMALGVEHVEDDAHLDVYSPAGFTGAARHLALMREPELVVTYLEGPESGPGTEWCGVFRPCSDLDRHFAQAEPPSHDDWLAGRVEDRNGKIFVKRGRQHGPRELFREFSALAGRGQNTGEAVSLAHVANQLGHLVGQGQRPDSAGGGTSGTGTASVSILDSQPVMLPGGSNGVVIDFHVPRAGQIQIDALVALAGGSSDDGSDTEDRQPRVLGITDCTATSPGASVPTPAQLERGDWRVWVANPGRVTVSARVQLSEGV